MTVLLLLLFVVNVTSKNDTYILTRSMRNHCRWNICANFIPNNDTSMNLLFKNNTKYVQCYVKCLREMHGYNITTLLFNKTTLLFNKTSIITSSLDNIKFWFIKLIFCITFFCTYFYVFYWICYSSFTK